MTRILVLLVFGVVASAAAQSTRTDRPNILLVLIDDLGKEWVSCYGAEGIETPRIDALARGGLQFENAYCMPQCTPSRLTMLTGQYPFRHGWLNHWDVPRWGHGAHYDPTRNPSLGRVMRDAGYATCAAGKWQVSDFRVQPRAMHDHGFDDWCMWTGYETGNPPSGERHADCYVNTPDGSRTIEGGFGPDVYTDRLIAFMQAHRAEPMFLYFPMALTHTPFVATPDEPDAQGKEARHRAMVRYADKCIGRLVDALAELGLREKTLVVVTTDNGTARGITGRRHGRAVQGAKTLHNEAGVCVPFVASWPSVIEPGVSRALTDFTDILPTCADLAGASLPEGEIRDGVSIGGVLRGERGESGRPWILAMGAHPAAMERGRVVPVHAWRDRVLRDNRFKLVMGTDREPEALFDLREDPWEQNDLLGTASGEARAALERLQAAAMALPERDAAPRYRKLAAQEWDREKTRRPERGRPNVILFMADDLGWGDLKCNVASSPIRTPHLDELARGGIVFNRFYAQSPVCSPTRGSVLTGRHAFRYGVQGANKGHLPQQETTLAEVLRQQGYTTGHFGKWHLGTLTETVRDSNRGGPRGVAHFSPPARHGFDVCFATEAKVPTFDPLLRPAAFESRPDGSWGDLKRGWDPLREAEPRVPYGTRYWNELGEEVVDGTRGDDSAVIVDRVLPFVERATEDGRPFFAVVWFHAPHLPVVAGAEDLARYADAPSRYHAHYYGCVTALDRQVGRVMQRLHELGVADDTLVAFTSDNGPEGKAAAPGSAGPLRGRKRSLYEGGVRVPGILHWPLRWPDAVRLDAAACTSDYLPTIAGLVGAQLEAELDGVDLVPMIESGAPRPRALGFQTGGMATWHEGKWKLVGVRREQIWHWELYDLDADPGEAADLAASTPGRVTAMRTELAAWQQRCRER